MARQNLFISTKRAVFCWKMDFDISRRVFIIPPCEKEWAVIFGPSNAAFKRYVSRHGWLKDIPMSREIPISVDRKPFLVISDADGPRIIYELQKRGAGRVRISRWHREHHSPITQKRKMNSIVRRVFAKMEKLK